ncbi:methyltransferase domain-containing protein [Candidatus Woesearchaeota archaeon]|nr:methyltransferase domain-containing protein [Candidatus Woesearchaeota archaeon]
MNGVIGKNSGQMVAPKNNGCGSSNGSSKPLTLVERLNNSKLPRKSFEVSDLNEGMPVTCIPEVIEIANNYLEHYGIDPTKGDDTTQWDIFWAREMAAAKMAIGIGGIDYQQFLPGRHFMYGLLADSIASLVKDGNGGNLKGKKIAEFGGGSGIGLILLAQQGAFVTNLDTSRMGLEFSRYLAQHHRVENMIDLVPGSFYEAPFEPGRFDAVYNAGVFEHLENDQARQLLGEMTRTTKPGGYVVIAIPNVNSPFYTHLREKEKSVYDRFKQIFARLPWEERRHTFDFRRLMEDAGLDFIKEDGLLIPPSQEVKKSTIPEKDFPIFNTYLPHGSYRDIGSIISSWKVFHTEVDPAFRMKYGWAIYAVGQKRAA